METAALGVSLAIIPALTWVLYNLHTKTVDNIERGWQSAEMGWQNAVEVNREVRNLLTARVATLENRLLSHSWGEFANLQNVPTALDKSVHADSIRREEDRLVREAMNERISYQGDDLEAEDNFETFEGPTVG